MRPQGALRSLLALTVPGAILAAIASLVMLAADVRDEIQELARTSSTNAQWSLSQPDMELLHLLLAAQNLQWGLGTAEELERRYDILYSRIRLLDMMPFYPEDLALPPIARGIEAARQFLSETEALFDGPVADLPAAVPFLVQKAEELRPQLREMTLRSLQQRTLRSDEQRETLRQTLLRLMAWSAVLMAALLLAVLALSRLVRRARLQTARVRTAHRRLSAVITASQDAIIVLDERDHILDANAAALGIFGVGAAEIEEAPVQRFICGSTGADGAGVLPPPGARLVRLEARRGDGRIFPAECSLTAIETESGPLRICFLRDISDRLAQEAALVSARDRALAGEKAKAEVLAVMSHEMRTPLNGILGTLDLIRPDMSADQRADYDQIIRNSAEQLLAHVNDVLDIARMNVLRLQPRAARFDAATLLRDIAAAQEGVAARRGNRLLLDLPSEGLCGVWGDCDRVHQVLLNLVSNAVKFTRDGVIRLRASRAPGSDEVIFEVSDSGIGIAPEDQERIFEEFVTLDSSYNRETQGTGLGLAISRRLATLMGGRLEVESRPGEGSCFRFALPLPPAPEPAAPPAADRPAPAPIPPLSVLVVEDNEINRFVARRMLEEDGHQVHEAFDGQEALRRIHEARFDLILMDISMPGLDGVETTRRIRASESPNRSTPVVALTAHARPEDRARFAEGGIARSLTKPLRRAALRSLLLEFTPSGPSVAAVDALKRPKDPPMLIDQYTLTELRQSLGDDSFRSLWQRFETETATTLELLCTAPQPPAEVIAQTAHHLAGSAGLFGLARLHEALAQIEDLARESPQSGTDPLTPALQALPDLWRESRERAIAA